MCDQLSEGELISSEGSDKETTQLAKRPRTETDDLESTIHNVKEEEAVSQEMEDLTDGEGWQMVEKGTRKRETLEETPLSHKKKKKRKRSVPVAELVQPPTNHQSYLNNPQKQLLRHLCQLIKVEDNWPTHPLFKTVDLQAVLRHICTGSPHCGKKLKRAQQLAERKVVMIWLSMVSKVDFLESEVMFSKTKSLPDKVVFTIQHPGSNRFVRMGLEAFMEVPVPPNAAEESKPSNSDCFTRADCVLSQEEMIENSYPCPLVLSNKSNEQYITITEWSQSENDEVASLPIFAVDCEMVMTCEGHELARVSIVNESFECIYDTLVKPLNPVSDYLTKYSGIDADMLTDVTTTLQEVHQQIRTILPSRFILAGHSLENDLQALKLFHPYVIDTSCLFTPNATPLLKPSLKKLTRNILDKDIQTDITGHSSVEDATACMELVLKKLREGPGLTMPFNNQGKTMLLPYLASQLVGSTIVDKPSITGMFGKGLTKCVHVESDSAALVQTKEILAKKITRFLFVQLHGMEQYLKFGERSPAAYVETVNSLDQAVFEIFEACPAGYLFMVVTGSSYLTEVRRLQQQMIINHAELEKEVMIAREGFVTAVLTPDNTQQDTTTDTVQ